MAEFTIVPSGSSDETLRDLLGAYHARHKPWKRVAVLLGFVEANGDRHLEDFRNASEDRSLTPQEFDQLLAAFAALDRSELRELLGKRGVDLIEGYEAAKAHYSIRNEIGVTEADQEDLFKEFGPDFLTFRRIDSGSWAVGSMKIYAESRNELRLPRFYSWRPVAEGGYVKLRGFLFKSGPNIFLNGHLLRQSHIWSAVYRRVGNTRDLTGLHLSTETSGHIRSSRSYCVSIKREEFGETAPFRGILDAAGIERLKKPLGPARFKRVNDALTAEPGDLNVAPLLI